MKAKLLFIEVEKSRLQRCKEQGNIQLFKKESDGIYQVRDIPVLYQPIKPVLVGEGEIKEGDHMTNGVKVYHNKVQLDGYIGFKKVLTQDTEELYEQIAKGELVEGEWYHFDSSYRKEDTGITKLDRPLRGCQWRAPLINFNPEPNEVTNEEINNQGTMTRTKEQTEAIITALTKLSEKFYADMDRIVNGGGIYEPDIKIEGGKATFKPIEGIELDPVKYWDQVRIEEVPEPNEVTEEEIESKLEELQDEAHQNNIGTNEAELEVRQRFAKWDIERMKKPPQDTTSQESKDYWKKYYNK